MNHRTRWIIATLGTLAAVIVVVLATPEIDQSRFWHEFVAPGPLTAQHAFMVNDCNGCHVPVNGVDPVKCIGCHANETGLLGRQPTAFHENIGNCTECHREHEGVAALNVRMDHEVLARIGVRMLAKAPENSEQRLLHDYLFAHADTGSATADMSFVKQLNCYGCHRNEDRHGGLFGGNCAACHTVAQWMIQDFRHPSPSSPDCAQCHRAPPSHYMGHFEMVSKRVAGVEHANVTQCHLCHQTTSWNDIKRVGMYDHH